jgi:hypothetical protein
MTFSSRHPRVRELTFQKLITQKISDMNLEPRDTLRECLIQLRHELQRRHISFFPHFYFGEEPWGCVDRTGSIEIPFFLANAALTRIASRYYISYSKEEIMMLLRHETGHAINYVYKVWKNPEWRSLFGKFHKRYRNFYNYHPNSRDFVRHLHYIGNPHYAQKHPDEDFAETFAVWLDPESKWKWNYRHWPGASKKLAYIDRIFRADRVAERRPLKVRYKELSSYRSIDTTIAEYFTIERKVDQRIREYTQDMKEIFSGVGPRARRTMRADIFIQNYSEYLINELTTWISGIDRREVKGYLREIRTICALNNLRLLPDNTSEKLIELVIVSTYYMLRR